MPPLPYWKLKVVVDAIADAELYRPIAAAAVAPLVHVYFSVAHAATKTIAAETPVLDCSNVVAVAGKTTAAPQHLKSAVNPHLKTVVHPHLVDAVHVALVAAASAVCSHAAVTVVGDATPVATPVAIQVAATNQVATIT